jgi:hypothetical protein
MNSLSVCTINQFLSEITYSGSILGQVPEHSKIVSKSTMINTYILKFEQQRIG